MNNAWYEKRCGRDSKDWIRLGEFQIVGVYGVGIGTTVGENDTYLYE